jgi:hypothetical protein
MTTGKKTRLFAPFDTKNDRFAKTGSGQTHRENSKREVHFLIATATPVTASPARRAALSSSGARRRSSVQNPRPFGAVSRLKTINLPRQARDKHIGKAERKGVDLIFCRPAGKLGAGEFERARS